MRYIVLLLLVGCSVVPTVYTQPDKSAADFNADSYVCNQDAREYAGRAGGETLAAAAVAQAFNRERLARRFYECMTLRGWDGPGAQAPYGKAAYGSAT